MGPENNHRNGVKNRFAVSALAGSILLAMSAGQLSAADSEQTTKRQIPYVLKLQDNKSGGSDKPESCRKRMSRSGKHLGISDTFKYHDQVACLDLGDPAQADRLLQFMDIRLAERQLDEEVVLVKNGDEAKVPASSEESEQGMQSTAVTQGEVNPTTTSASESDTETPESTTKLHDLVIPLSHDDHNSHTSNAHNVSDERQQTIAETEKRPPKL